MPWALSKSNWVIWGADLYSYQKPKHSFRSKLIESMKQHVIERIGGLVTYLSEDVALARKWYKAKGEYIECLMYPSNLFNVQELKINVQVYKSILVGNSADPSNNHIEIFKKLEKFKHENIIVYVPLAYGSKEYASHVISEGEKIFGDRFVPLTNFMAFDDYMKFLQGIHIAIFAHRRQQGMGNTISLLGMGKKVVIRKQVSQWSFFKELGITVFDFEGLDLELMKVDNSEKNKKLVNIYFSHERFCHQLNMLFK